MSEKAEFVAAITEMLGRKAPEPEPGPTRPITDLSDDELDEQTEVIAAEKQRRREDAGAEAFGEALVGSLTKRRHQALIDEPAPLSLAAPAASVEVRMAVLRACATCGKPSPAPYCPEHQPKPWATSRRAERSGISGGKWQTIRMQVLARDHGCCYLCGNVVAEGEPIEVDHLVPLAEGGGNDLTNLATVHAGCHARRHREPDWAAEAVAAALRVLGGWHPPRLAGGEKHRDRWLAGGALRDRISGMARDRAIRVLLDDDELARLDELRPPGTSRPAFIRSLLREPPRGDDVATRSEALQILTGLARDGRVAAAIALERALRDEAPVGDQLDEILGGRG